MVSSTATFVGRVTQSERLHDAAGRAAHGEPSVVLVAGEAGVGKSRLIDEAARRLADTGWRVSVGHCMDLTEPGPYSPILEALRDLFGEPGALTKDALGIGIEPGSATWWGRTSLFATLLGELDRASLDAPLVLVIEDLHWADPSTMDAIRYLARAIRRERLLIVGSYRTDELHRTHPWLVAVTELGRLDNVTRVDVEPFDREEVAELLAGLLGGAPTDDLVARVLKRSDGNAFFIEELVAAGGAWVGDGTSDLVPRTIRDIVAVRLARLGPDAQALADLAAVAGRRVAHAPLATLSDLDEDALLAGIRELIDARILVPDDDVTGPGYRFRHALTQETAYHSLISSERRVLHAAIARWLGEHDDPSRPRIGHLVDLRHHALGAGDTVTGLRLSVEAGDEATRILAYAEAHANYERGLDLWHDVPAPELVTGIAHVDLLERAADAAAAAADFTRAIDLSRAVLHELGPDGDPDHRIHRFDRLAWCQWDLGEADAAERTLREAMASMPSDQPRWRARLLTALAQLHWSATRYFDGVTVAREALEMARAAGDPVEEGWARMILGATLAAAGDGPNGVVELERAAMLLADDDRIDYAIQELTWALQFHGRCQEAVDLALRAIQAAGGANSRRRYVPYFLSVLCDALDQLGDYGRIAYYLETVDWPRNGGRASAWLFQNLVTFELSRGDLARARDALDAAAARLPDGAAHFDWLWYRWSETELALAEGRLDAARQLAHEAIDAAPDPTHDAVLWRLFVTAARVDADIVERGIARRADPDEVAAVRADLLTVGRTFDAISADARAEGRMTPMLELYGRLVAAECTRPDGGSDPDAWSAVVDAAEPIGFRPDAAYARYRESEAELTRHGPTERAASSLRQARSIALEIDDRPLLERIDGLGRRGRIDVDPAPRRAPDEEPWGLSRRERDVLALVADGRTNRQIGEALFITEKTASVHVTHILDKLGVSSRTEAALLAARAGDLPALTVEGPGP